MHTNGYMTKLASLICAITVAGVGAMAVDSTAIAEDYKAENIQVTDTKNTEIKVADTAVYADGLLKLGTAKSALTEKKIQAMKVAETAKKAAEQKKLDDAAMKTADEAIAQSSVDAQAAEQDIEIIKVEEPVKEEPAPVKKEEPVVEKKEEPVEKAEEPEAEAEEASNASAAEDEKEEAKAEEKAEEKEEPAEEAAAEEEAEEEEEEDPYHGLYMNSTYDPDWNQNSHLTRFSGIYYGPSGKESYYNLNMSGVVSIMRRMGFSEEEYPYWVRDDGCKMLGDFIMVAADFGIRARGTLVPTSLGIGIVCDTGGFAASNKYQLDIATNW